jgi:TATA-binding protein-associated factor Taf7
MEDEATARLMGYHRRRYWLCNGWCLRFSIKKSELSQGRPHGIKYSLTLHDVDMSRILGFDNAHGISRCQLYDHKHRFRRTSELVPYEFIDADRLLVDFFEEVEKACRSEGVEFAFDEDETDLDEEAEHGEDFSSDAP